MAFDIEKKFLDENEGLKDGVNKKQKLNSDEVEKLEKQYPLVPRDYLDYLMEIGAGTIREIQFKVQPYLFDFVDLGLEDVYQVKDTVKFFGDNFNGDFAGFDFDNSDGTVVEFLHESNELSYTNKTFKEFIREQMLMGENGQDIRSL